MPIGQVGETLKKWRKEHGLSQEQLCEELGISRTHYSKIENNILKPTTSYLERICDFYGYRLSDLKNVLVKAQSLTNIMQGTDNPALTLDDIMSISFPTEDEMKYGAAKYLLHVLDTATPNYVDANNKIHTSFMNYLKDILGSSWTVDYLDVNGNSFQTLLREEPVANIEIHQRQGNFRVEYVVLINTINNERARIPINVFLDFQEDFIASTEFFFERFFKKVKEES